MPTYKEVLLGSGTKVKARKCNDTGGWKCLSDADVDKVMKCNNCLKFHSYF